MGEAGLEDIDNGAARQVNTDGNEGRSVNKLAEFLRSHGTLVYTRSRYTTLTFSIPFSGAGNSILRPFRVRTRASDMTQFRYHLWSLGTTYQGA